MPRGSINCLIVNRFKVKEEGEDVPRVETIGDLNEIINPFNCGFNTMEFQQRNSHICHSSLDATHHGQTFYCYVLHINGVLPKDAYVFFMLGSDGGITIGFGNVEGSSLSAWWALCKLKLDRISFHI